MRASILFNKISLTSLSAVFFVQAVGAAPVPGVNTDEMTKQASALCSQGKVQAALELENKAVRMAPDYWLPHAALSYIKWSSNDHPNALKEAQTALRLSPNNPAATLNLAVMTHQSTDYGTAIPLYKQAIKLEPYNWVASIGLVQCLVMMAQVPEALQNLDQMAATSVNNFAWFYQTADIYNKLGKAKQAQVVASKALELASTPEEKSLSRNLLFVASLRANDLDRAKALKEQVLSSKPKDKDIYIGAAQLLYPVSDPAGAKALVDCAIDSQVKDSDVFYRLGRTFDERLSAAEVEAAKQVKQAKDDKQDIQQSWRDVIEEAYRQAIKLDPQVGKYHLALAGVLDAKGSAQEMLSELDSAKSGDVKEPLSQYLASKLKSGNNDIASQLRQKIAGEAEKPNQLNLTKANFVINNLKCGCKIPILEFRLKTTNGVEAAAIFRGAKPFKGTVLVDQSLVTLNELFAKYSAKDPAAGLTLQLLSSEPVTSVAEAIKLSQSLREPDSNVTLDRFWTFNPLAPKMPTISQAN